MAKGDRLVRDGNGIPLAGGVDSSGGIHTLQCDSTGKLITDSGPPPNWVAINTAGDSLISGVAGAPAAARGIFVGGAGNVKVDTAGGQTVTIPAPIGQLSGEFVKVYSAANGTTATTLFWTW